MFNRVTRMGSHIFGILDARKFWLVLGDFKMGRLGVKKLLQFFIQFNKCVTSF